MTKYFIYQLNQMIKWIIRINVLYCDESKNNNNNNEKTQYIAEYRKVGKKMS